MNAPPETSGRRVGCPRCQTLLPMEFTEETLQDTSRAYRELTCPSCQLPVEFYPVPAGPIPLPSSPLPVASADSQVDNAPSAACFFHAHRKAQSLCSCCGRYVCEICELKLETQVYCAECLERTSRAGELPILEPSRIRYDLTAIWILTLTFIVCLPFGGLGAVLAASLLIWKWKAPPSLLVPTRIFQVSILAFCLLLVALNLYFWIVLSESLDF